VGQQRIGYAHENTTWTTFWRYDGEPDPNVALDLLAEVPTIPEAVLKAPVAPVLQAMMLAALPTAEEG